MAYEDMEHIGEAIELTEEVECAHRNYLAEFDEKVAPIFLRYGYTKDAALLFWMLNRVRNDLRELADELRRQL